MKNNIYFLISLFLLLSLLFFSLSVKALTDLTPACNNEIANSVNDPSYPDVCEVRSQSLDPVTCCSSKEFNGLSTVSFMDSLGFKVSIGWFVLCPQKTVTFNGVSAASGCIAQTNTLCGLVNSGETTCSLPQSSVCCAATSGFSSPTPTPTPTSTPSPASSSITQTHLESAKELNKQAQKELNEGKYVEASATIDNTIESLNDAKDTLQTDPIILESCGSKPDAINKIERGIQSSIDNHNKASSIVDRIIDIVQNPISGRVKSNSNTEELLQKLIKAAKELLNGRRLKRNLRPIACSIRG